MPSESEQQFDEDQELQQIIDGKICMKIYHFSHGTVNWLGLYFDLCAQLNIHTIFVAKGESQSSSDRLFSIL